MIRVHAQRVVQYLFVPAIITIAFAVAFISGCGGGSNSSPAPAPVIVVTAVPTTASLRTGQVQVFTATVDNDDANKGVRWTLSGGGCSAATCGTLSAATSASGAPVTYTAPAAMPSPATVTLTASAMADATKTAAAAITLAAAANVSVALSATSATVPISTTTSFAATVANDAENKGVAWTLSGTGCSGTTCGTLSAANSASGTPVTYSAPATAPTPPSVTLTAASVADGTKTAAATITITSVSAVTITPKRGGLVLGQRLNFTAKTTPPGGTVTWTASSGTITPTSGTNNATYVAPTSPGQVTITATDGLQIATATIGVTDLAGVTTYHNDLSRDGVNAQEYALDTTNVTSATFGKLFSCTADGAIHAQPLWVANVTIGGAPHNVIVAATAHDSVYVYDADASPCVTYWHANLLDSAHGGTSGETPVPSGPTLTPADAIVGFGIGDIDPETGVIGTPVIDPETNTIYVVSKSVILSGHSFFQRIHALDLTTGAEKFSGPRAISASVAGSGAGSSGGNVPFSAQTQLQRTGLALVNGAVYVAWASHEDADPYHGWVIGYDKSTLAQVTKYNDTRNGDRGGIWMSGAAPAADSNNNLYVITGNGTYNGTDAYGDSFLKLSTVGGLAVADWFTPSTQATLESTDKDFGAGGAAVLIDQTSGPLPHLAVGGGKDQNLFLLNRDDLGHNNPTDRVVQTLPFDHGIFATPAFWQNSLYLAGGGGTLKQYAFDTGHGVFKTSFASQSAGTFGWPGVTPSISSQAATNGIVWAINSSAYGATNNGGSSLRAAGPAVLHAYSATNLATELWYSSQATGGRDQAGNAVKFTVPTVANGKVYIGTRGNDDTQGNGTTFGEIDVYGLLPN